LIGLCGEESFGTGSPHIREKDGLWTILAWLQVLAKNNEGVPEGSLVGVETLLNKFWAEFGRNYYSRYDFENIPTEKGQAVWNHLVSQVETHVLHFLLRKKEM
jgi:phosphoglucomutase